MDEVLFGSVWNAISPMLDTDDVVRMRVASQYWNDGSCYGKLGSIFFQLLHSDPFAKHWYYDAHHKKRDNGDGPDRVRECILTHNCHIYQNSTYGARSDTRSWKASAEWASKRPRCFIHLMTFQRYVECHSIDTTSNGRISLD